MCTEKITPLPFGFFKIDWSGNCDPAKKGYIRVFSNIYWREKNYESKKRFKEVQKKKKRLLIGGQFIHG